MDLDQLMLHVEALLFASDRPLTPSELTGYASLALEMDVEEERVVACIQAIDEKYNAAYYPFGLRELGGGYQFLTKSKFHSTVLQLNGDKHIRKLSTAAMETLSIIAYKQPVTKSEIEFIRGVSADYSIQKLLEKELIIISGRKEDAVGKPLIYATSRSFMDYLGINSPAGLPALKEINNIEVIVPTDALEALPNDMASMLVGVEGDLKVNGNEEDGLLN